MALEQIQRDLEDLRAAVPELRGVLLASIQGQPLGHSLSQEVDPELVAAMAAAASSLGRRVSDSLGVGTLNEISISGTDGHIFIYNASAKAVLAVIGPNGADTGLIHLESRWAAREIGEKV